MALCLKAAIQGIWAYELFIQSNTCRIHKNNIIPEMSIASCSSQAPITTVKLGRIPICPFARLPVPFTVSRKKKKSASHEPVHLPKPRSRRLSKERKRKIHEGEDEEYILCVKRDPKRKCTPCARAYRAWPQCMYVHVHTYIYQ
jgi:hypothetical protein